MLETVVYFEFCTSVPVSVFTVALLVLLFEFIDFLKFLILYLFFFYNYFFFFFFMETNLCRALVIQESSHE